MKGKLKIFFGYSAGVGKTYHMLQLAHEVKKDGVDVVIGYIEPHDRIDTMKLTEGLEKIPLKTIEYKGIKVNEFDVDKAIKRKPDIMLVDELAHTNMHGSKNKKRYIDIEEILNNGIDVWTTVNVQHIEGLHDLVDSATEVDVNERVPDEVFDMADEVVLIDIEPVDLIERMKEGKVYNKTRAKIALENFFNEDNLTSLRELFLRRGADRIEKITYCGKLRPKILVLVSPSPSTEKNIHVAARMADAYHCKFVALYVEQNGELSDESAENLKKHISLVRDLGGEIKVKYSDNIIDTIVDFVRLTGIESLVMGKTWDTVGTKVGLEDKLIARMPNVEILIVPDSEHCGYKTKHIVNFFKSIFMPSKLLKKYRLANKTLDIINLVADCGKLNNKEYEIAKTLAIAFERNCVIYCENAGVDVVFKINDNEFFESEKEKAVAKWVCKNNKPAGRGTDTLREAKAIYFPIKSKFDMYVIGFSCFENKMTVTDKMVFSQLQSILQVVL